MLLVVTFLDHKVVVGIVLDGLVNAGGLVVVVGSVLAENSANVGVVQDGVALANPRDEWDALLGIRIVDQGVRAPRSHGLAGVRVKSAVFLLEREHATVTITVGGVFALHIFDLGVRGVVTNDERLLAVRNLLGHDAVDFDVNVSLGRLGLLGRRLVALPLVATGLVASLGSGAMNLAFVPVGLGRGVGGGVGTVRNTRS